MAVALEALQVTKEYPSPSGEGIITAVDGMEMVLERGEFVALVRSRGFQERRGNREKNDCERPNGVPVHRAASTFGVRILPRFSVCTAISIVLRTLRAVKEIFPCI